MIFNKVIVHWVEYSFESLFRDTFTEFVAMNTDGIEEIHMPLKVQLQSLLFYNPQISGLFLTAP